MITDNYELIFGDCIREMDKIENACIDLVLCDMPYGTTNCKWDTVIDLKLMWEQLNRLVKPNCAILLFAQTPFDKVLGVSNLKMLRYEWIWEKPSATGHLNAKKMPMKAHENILVFYKKLPTYNPIKTFNHKPVNSFTKSIKTGNNTEIYNKTNQVVSGGGNTDRYPRSVQVFSSDKQKLKLHATQKPVALLEYLIKTYSNVGDTVLDFTMGSASTGEACINTGRYFIGIDNDIKSFNTAEDRLAKIKGSK